MDETVAAMGDLERLERIIDHLLNGAGIISPPVPINIVALIDPSMPVRIVERQLQVYRAALKPSAGRWLIIVNQSLPRAAQRFSIAHEAFHILQRNGFATSKDHVSPYVEWLANQFAARVLMPRRWVVELAPKARNARHLAGIFYVSEKAMSRRLGELNLKFGGRHDVDQQPTSARVAPEGPEPTYEELKRERSPAW